ncbi:MAG: biotin/lipoyl-binding protein [Pirellulaceae bacterium]|nr:biotin/lipoyl-binding protein [Pirellulaceae bacterium]
MIFNRLFAWGSVLGALLILAYAVRLIFNNTPTRPTGEARVMPPTQPGLTREVAYQPQADSDKKASAASEGSATSTTPQRRFIGGIGIVEPAGEAISIGTQLSGLVTEVLVRPGDLVRRGEPLFVLDSRSAQASLAIAVANEQAAIAKLKELEGQIAPTRSKLAASQALLNQAKADAANASQQYQRAKQLAASSSISQEEVEARRLAFEMSSAKVAEGEARVNESQATLDLLAGAQGAPTLDVQRAAIAQAAANVSLARVNVELLTVRAPLDATVLQVRIRVGEFAAAAVLTNALMVLGVTDPLHVRVEIDESEIPRFHAGTKAYAAVRGRADQQVPLRFVRAEPLVVPKRSLSGGVSERVDTRVLELIYAVTPQALGATVGQQVDVFIEE